MLRKAFAVVTLACAVLSMTASPAEARFRFRMRHVPVVVPVHHSRPSSSPSNNPWAKDDAQQTASDTNSEDGGIGSSGIWLFGLLIALVVAARVLWTWFRAKVNHAQANPDPDWSPQAPAKRRHRDSDFEQRLEQRFAEQRAQQGFGRRTA